MRKFKAFVAFVCVIVIIGCSFCAYAEELSDSQSETTYRFHENFTAGKPTDARFIPVGYSAYSGGIMKTKVQNTSRAGASVKTEGVGSNLYFECDAQFVFDVGFKMMIKDISGAEEGIFYDSKNLELKDNSGNVIKTISKGSITRKIGILMLGKKAYLFENGAFLCDMMFTAEEVSEILFIWSNTGSLDYRPSLDNLLVTNDESEFPSLPEEYTKAPSIVSVSTANGEEAVDISRNFVAVEFDIAIADIKDGDIEFYYGTENTPQEFSSLLSDDGTKLTVSATEKLNPLTTYTFKVNKTVKSRRGEVPMQEEYVISFTTADGKLTAGDIEFEKTPDTLKAFANLTNESSKPLRATLILCVCIGDETEFVTESAQIKTCEILSGETLEIAVSSKIEIPDNAFFKALLWESEDDMNPIRPGVVYEPENEVQNLPDAD